MPEGRPTSNAAHLAAIVESSDDAILSAGLDGVIESCNAAAERIFGYARAELIGRTVRMLLPPDRFAEEEAIMATIRRGERVDHFETVRLTKSGQPIDLSLTASPVRDEAGHITGASTIARDITAQKRAFKAQAHLAAIIESSDDAILSKDLEGVIQSCNATAERLFGYSAVELVGHSVRILIPPERQAEEVDILARILRGESVALFETVRLTRAGRRVNVSLSISPIRDSAGAIIGVSKIARDISARVQMEEQLREQAALVKVGEMVASIAHEIKNPLAGIRGAIQVLGNQTQVDGTRGQIFSEIVSRIDALDQMMKDLLLFGRPPKPRYAPTDITPLVTATVDLLTKDPALQHVDILVEGSAPPVTVDPDMLRIVFQNLLINSAHAMHGKGRIRVAVGTVEASCQIAFVDDGPGIPPEIREKIFVPFFTTKSRGTGLGLPTAKRLIEAQKGQIVIDCPPAGGTAVFVRLPL